MSDNNKFIKFSNTSKNDLCAATPTWVKIYAEPKKTSDIRLKTNLKNSNLDSLNVINQIKIRSFDWTGGIYKNTHWDVGVIADELEQIDTRFVNQPTLEDDDQLEYKSVDTWYLTGHILKAIQQLSEKIDQLESKISNM